LLFRLRSRERLPRRTSKLGDSISEKLTRVYADGGELRDEGRRQILVDTETGVHYLVWKSGYAGGITPLLDAEGNVVITKSDC
jgi:hypothetical protein